ncbi:MAG: hypothetical protein ACYTKD_08335 [Planctomycetota bacterium]|jgi:hypothetical protein
MARPTSGSSASSRPPPLFGVLGGLAAAVCVAGCYDLTIVGESDAEFVPSLDLRCDFAWESAVERRVSPSRTEPYGTRTGRLSFRAGLAGFRGEADAVLEGWMEGPGPVYGERVEGFLEGGVGRIDMGFPFAVDEASGQWNAAALAGVGYVVSRFTYRLAGEKRFADCSSIVLDAGLDVRRRLTRDLRLGLEGHFMLPFPHLFSGSSVGSTDARAVLEVRMGRHASLVAGWRWMKIWAEDEGHVETDFSVSGPTAGLVVTF